MSRFRQTPVSGAPRVVVVGMGFGGLATVRTLSGAGLRVTLVDRDVYSTFQPLLYQVATGGLTPSDVAYPLRGFAHKYGGHFVRGELRSVDAGERTITLADGSQIPYDYLILATGVAAAFYGVTGADKHSFALYTRRDAVALRDQIMAGLEQLSSAERGRETSLTVVGGGPTGVELAGTLAELRNIALATAFPEIDRSRVHIKLVEMAPALLSGYVPKLQEYAHQQLLDRGVEVRLNTTIKEITPDHVVLSGGETVHSDLTVWAAGVRGPEAADDWGVPLGRGGRVQVGPDLRVIGQDRIFAIGDIALTGDDPLPQLAQPALQMGRFAADQVVRLVAGRPTGRFSYHDKGIVATIGRRSAVVQLPYHVRIRGTLAWIAWFGLHIVTLLGSRNRISALINLSYRYLSWGRGGSVLMDSDPPDTWPPRRGA
ncbi:MAG TPA: NAD(P)/FAD-dependent oxidoreductase [Streptosporangiaceae bacterium]|nr:NAD(P)/FAD-dependent oxidoreductase [Streptosporangiaceae bacterium]